MAQGSYFSDDHDFWEKCVPGWAAATSPRMLLPEGFFTFLQISLSHSLPSYITQPRTRNKVRAGRTSLVDKPLP